MKPSQYYAENKESWDCAVFCLMFGLFIIAVFLGILSLIFRLVNVEISNIQQIAILVVLLIAPTTTISISMGMSDLNFDAQCTWENIEKSYPEIFKKE